MCESKVCTKCGIEQPLDNFYEQKTRKTKYRSICKTCSKLQDNERIEKFIYVKITEKYCKQCNTIKSVTEFYKNKRIKDGYSSACKQCSDKSKKDRANNYTKSSKNIIEKRCTKCNIIKPVSKFRLYKYNKDGYSYICTSCMKQLYKIKYRHKPLYGNVVHNIDNTKQCTMCKEIKNTREFYKNKYNKDGLEYICKKCSNKKNKKCRQQNPELYKMFDRKQRAIRKNFGYNPINKSFKFSDAHHLHLENNNAFVILIPRWLHKLYGHKPTTWKNMDTINAIALDFWINEELYKDLYEL